MRGQAKIGRMKTEKEKMLEGELYDSSDPQLVKDRLNARELCFRLNGLPPSQFEKDYNAIADELFANKSDVFITPPFQCDYGKNITLGSNVYFNFNCIVLDVAEVRIGNNVLFGPGVQVLTAFHPMNAELRRSGLELGRSVEIGDDVWIGGAAVICAGVEIGNGAVVGAGSIVTKNIPEYTLAAGNPCKVIRAID